MLQRSQGSGDLNALAQSTHAPVSTDQSSSLGQVVTGTLSAEQLPRASSDSKLIRSVSFSTIPVGKGEPKPVTRLPQELRSSKSLMDNYSETHRGCMNIIAYSRHPKFQAQYTALLEMHGPKSSQTDVRARDWDLNIIFKSNKGLSWPPTEEDKTIKQMINITKVISKQISEDLKTAQHLERVLPTAIQGAKDLRSIGQRVDLIMTGGLGMILTDDVVESAEDILTDSRKWPRVTIGASRELMNAIAGPTAVDIQHLRQCARNVEPMLASLYDAIGDAPTEFNPTA